MIDKRPAFTSLPAELLLRIYEVLPSFNDALHLHKTCRTLHGVWKKHRTTIVNALVFDHFECYPYAWKLLGDWREQEQPPLDKNELSDRHVSKLLRNAKVIEDLIIKYIEQELIPKLKVEGIPPSKRNTTYAGTSTHPPQLTPTERLRIIKACYQIWDLTRSDESSVREKCSTFRPRELFYINELTSLCRYRDFPSGDRWEIYQPLKFARRAFFRFYSEMYGCQAPEFQLIREYDDPVDLFVVWDHWQDGLRNLICRRPVGNLNWEKNGEVREDLWDHEAGDENFIEGV